MEIKIIVYFHRQGFTRLESFVYHDTVSDSGEVILYSKPFYIDNFLVSILRLVNTSYISYETTVGERVLCSHSLNME